MTDLLERPLVYSVIGAFHDVYTYDGYGLIEAGYAGALEFELRDRGHEVCRELAVEIGYKGQHVCCDSSILASGITRHRMAAHPDSRGVPVRLARFVAIALSFAGASRLHAQYAGAVGQTIAGISCDAQEGQRIHIHQHLLILDHGKQVDIPPNVGQPAGQRCIYWLHTHTPDGIIHIEAPKDRSFTLGEFFQVWGQPISRTQAASAHGTAKAPLRVWVNGKRYSGDPARIKLDPHTDIVIEAGPPFAKQVPRFTKWGAL